MQATEASCELGRKSCVPCRGGVPALTASEIEALLPQLPQWRVVEVQSVKHLERTFSFVDFAQAIRFVNRVADLAESQGHHPDLHIHWNKVQVEMWTHKINGLHENDFILAARVDEAFGGSAHLWAEDPVRLPDGRTGASSIWDVHFGPADELPAR